MNSRNVNFEVAGTKITLMNVRVTSNGSISLVDVPVSFPPRLSVDLSASLILFKKDERQYRQGLEHTVARLIFPYLEELVAGSPSRDQELGEGPIDAERCALHLGTALVARLAVELGIEPPPPIKYASDFED